MSLSSDCACQIHRVLGFVFDFHKPAYFFGHVRADVAYAGTRHRKLTAPDAGIFLCYGGTMRNLTLLTTVFLSSSMRAATAGAQAQSQSHRCKSRAQSLPECQTIGVSTSASLNNLSVGSQIEFRTQRKWMNLHDGNKKKTTYLIQQVTAG